MYSSKKICLNRRFLMQSATALVFGLGFSTRTKAQNQAIQYGGSVGNDLPKEKRTPTTPLHDDDLKLWYKTPAEVWTEALPLGNGRLGAMVFGGVARDRIQFNEDTISAGAPYQPANKTGAHYLPKIRELIFAGKYKEAQALIQDHFMATPMRQVSYQTAGELQLIFGPSSQSDNYRRELDLRTAQSTISYNQEGVTYKRETFISPIDQVMVIRLSANKAGKVDVTAQFETPMSAKVAVDAQKDLVLSGKNGDFDGKDGVVRFESRVRVLNQGGTIRYGNDEIEVVGADTVLILVATATNFKSYQDVSGNPTQICLTQVDAASKRAYDTILADHIAAHQALFDRVSVDFGRTDFADLPTNERIKKSQQNYDPALAALYYQYGRYLLISCSRPGSQPANLQGLWNEKTSAPWGGKYTININTEMNYWPAEPTHLPELVAPLVQLVKDISVTGQETARLMYGARGWVAHHNTDLWRATGPVDGAYYGIWPTGGAWLCLHLWDHYDYGRNRAYLADIYPILKGSALFFVDSLVKDPNTGYMVTAPSISPENGHKFGTSICAGPSMDMQIIRDLFANTTKAATLLKTDVEFRKTLNTLSTQLAPHKIGKAGQLQEWQEDWDLEAGDIHHRHVSHLYGLFPSHQITVRKTPELAKAAAKSLDIRGDLSTGWAIAWRLNLWSRLGHGERAYAILRLLLGPERTYPNMFDAHPPFQIDGNFGGTSGMTEMLLQSFDDEIQILPALPSAWPMGTVSGLRARGGFGVDIDWDNGVLKSVMITSDLGEKAKLIYGQAQLPITLKKGQSARYQIQSGQFVRIN